MLGFRAYICDGDLTTSGGQVISASSTLYSAGRRIALEGDEAWCPVCQSVGTLSGGDPTSFDQGRRIMWDRGSVRCQCPQPPSVLASQQVYGSVRLS